MKAKPFTKEQIADLVENLEYNAETGQLHWTNNRSPKARAGMVAGGMKTTGYVAVLLNGKRYMAHRVVWLLAKGHDAPMEIDHIDGDKKNNKIENLRLCTRSQNVCARKYRTGNTGVRGLRERVRNGWTHYEARIKKDGKRFTKTFPISMRGDAIAWLATMRDELHGDFACHQ